MKINSININYHHKNSFGINPIGKVIKSTKFPSVQEYLANRESILAGYKPEFKKGVVEQIAPQIHDFFEHQNRAMLRQQAGIASDFAKLPLITW